MQDMLVTADIPPLIARILQPWINRAETTTRGMGEIVKDDTASASKSLRRRIIVTPPLEIAIVAAEKASVTLAGSFSHTETDDISLRSPRGVGRTVCRTSLKLGAFRLKDTEAIEGKCRQR